MGLRLNAWGRRRRRLAVQIAAIAIIVSATAAGLHTLRPLSSINARMSDLLVVAADAPAAVTIATIDDTTIARYGRLGEWSRALHATAVENLTKAGARVIAFDVLFADPAPGDDLLRRALGGSTVVLATAFTGSGHVAPGAGADTLEFDGFIAPLPSLAGVAQLAHANPTPDTDGVVRTVPLIVSGPNGVRQVSLAYATLARFFIQSPSTDLPVADGTAHLLAPLPKPLGRFAPTEPGASTDQLRRSGRHDSAGFVRRNHRESLRPGRRGQSAGSGWAHRHRRARYFIPPCSAAPRCRASRCKLTS